MQSKLNLISIILFTALGVFLLGFGALYASVQNLLGFHAAAVPKHALQDVRPFYFALMTLIGGVSAGLGLIGLYIAFGPIRAGARLAALFLAMANAIALMMAALTAEKLARATGAPTSWHIMGILMAVNFVGLGANILAQRISADKNSSPTETEAYS